MTFQWWVLPIAFLLAAAFFLIAIAVSIIIHS
jgi:hypothetical protein